MSATAGNGRIAHRRTDKAIGSDMSNIHGKLRQLEQKLADAWWEEAPLERIQQLENEIERHRRVAEDADSRDASERQSARA